MVYIDPGDFVTNLKQINNQPNLISISSFTGPSYLGLTIRSSVCMIWMWDTYIFDLCNLCRTGTYVGNLTIVHHTSMTE